MLAYGIGIAGDGVDYFSDMEDEWEKAPMLSPQRDDIGGLVSPVRKTDEETGVELNINYFPLSLPLQAPIIEGTTTDSQQYLSNPNSDAVRQVKVPTTTQDYVSLANIHRLQIKFSSHAAKFGEVPICLLCHKSECKTVLFPCEHRCVCDSCIQKESFCDADTVHKILNGFCNCPLCAQIIKKMLPYDNGKEIEKYWDWVNEVNPVMPSGFIRNFRHSAAIIQKIRIDDAKKEREQKGIGGGGGGSISCVIS